MDERKWVEKAKKDLDDAKFNLENSRVEVAAFLAHQAVEKALKSLYLKKFGRIRKIHDLVLLAKDVGLPERYMDACKELTAAYMYTRYPDIPEAQDIEQESKKSVSFAETVIKWTEEHL